MDEPDTRQLRAGPTLASGHQQPAPPLPLLQGSTSRPEHGLLDRPHLSTILDDAVANGSYTYVTAPAGSGKTATLTAWAIGASTPVAWYSVSRLDSDRERFFGGVEAALARLAETDDRYAIFRTPIGEAWPRGDGAARLIHRLSAIDSPTALIIDDAHRAGAPQLRELHEYLLGYCPSVCLLVAARPPATNGTARAQLHRQVVTIGKEDLNLTVDEVAAFARHLGVQADDSRATAIHQATGGWPVAVRLLLATSNRHGDSGPALDTTTFAAYVAEEILPGLEPEVRNVVLTTTIVDVVDATTAAALAGDPAAGLILERCHQIGLPIEVLRNEHRDGVAFRWHSLFADVCRSIVRTDDPGTALALDITAARQLADMDPLTAVRHARRGGSPELAVEILTAEWVRLVISSDVGVLSTTAANLPAPWPSHPAILLIRAACLDVLGDREGAETLFARGSALIDGEPSEDGAALRLTRALAALLVSHDHGTLAEACDLVANELKRPTHLGDRAAAAASFLTGWTELRLRRDPVKSIQLLNSALVRNTKLGERHVARSSAANLGFALAFAGRFGAARMALTDSPPDEGSITPWQIYDGGISAFASGFVSYWRDQLESAREAFLAVKDSDVGDTPYTGLARVHLVLVACAIGNLDLLAEAEKGLDSVPDEELRGVPWQTYKRLAQMKIAESRRDYDQALALAALIPPDRLLPVTSAMTAELYRVLGMPDAALTHLRSVRSARLPGYVRVSIHVTEALIHAHRGNAEKAHSSLAMALDLAVPEQVIRPFAAVGSEVLPLLESHSPATAKVENAIGSLMAHLRVGPTLAGPLPALSRREREVLSYLHTLLTTAEIADALFVSANTVKSHLKSIYRKLGVKDRRSAVRAASQYR